MEMLLRNVYCENTLPGFLSNEREIERQGGRSETREKNEKKNGGKKEEEEEPGKSRNIIFAAGCPLLPTSRGRALSPYLNAVISGGSIWHGISFGRPTLPIISPLNGRRCKRHRDKPVEIVLVPDTRCPLPLLSTPASHLQTGTPRARCLHSSLWSIDFRSLDHP